MNWLISANSKIYDHASSFEHHGHIDWRQNKTKYQTGDTVYIYCTSPIQRIRYKCEAIRVGMSYREIWDDEPYWDDKLEYKKSLEGQFVRLRLTEQIDTDRLALSELIKHGLKAAPQGPIKIAGELLGYIRTVFDSGYDDFFPDTFPSGQEVVEGLKKTVVVNKYERSSVARAMCIEHNGSICKICGFDFERIYGELGTGFIHVHHLIPIHKIGRAYKVDYKTDLMPVCPNCHAMLHKKYRGAELTPEELKGYIRESK